MNSRVVDAAIEYIKANSGLARSKADLVQEKIGRRIEKQVQREEKRERQKKDEKEAEESANALLGMLAIAGFFALGIFLGASDEKGKGRKGGGADKLECPACKAEEEIVEIWVKAMLEEGPKGTASLLRDFPYEDTRLLIATLNRIATYVGGVWHLNIVQTGVHAGSVATYSERQKAMISFLVERGGSAARREIDNKIAPTIGYDPSYTRAVMVLDLLEIANPSGGPSFGVAAGPTLADGVGIDGDDVTWTLRGSYVATAASVKPS